MTSATLDRALAVLVAALAATGLLSVRAGASDTSWLFALHGLLGGALLAAVVLKLARSVPRAAAARRWRRLTLGLLVGGVTLAALSGGFMWVASGAILIVGPWTLVSWHAVVGLLLLPLLVAHLQPRRWRLLMPTAARGVSRRSFLAGGALALAGAAMWGAANIVDAMRGGTRRFTGSRWLPAGGVPPPPTFLGESTSPIDPAAWRLRVHGRVEQPATYDLAGLRALGERDLDAVLDCTSGWAIDTTWGGVPLGAVLATARPLPGAGRVDVRAVTGWGNGLSLADAQLALLATTVAGGPLPHENGAPCRLVVPDRRGLDWVKWVTEIEVS